VPPPPLAILQHCLLVLSLLLNPPPPQVEACDESLLLRIVATRPVLTCIDACDLFMWYGGGIYSTDCGRDLNHAVVIVGKTIGGHLAAEADFPHAQRA
jgi:hypothetical protein